MILLFLLLDDESKGQRVYMMGPSHTTVKIPSGVLFKKTSRRHSEALLLDVFRLANYG